MEINNEIKYQRVVNCPDTYAESQTDYILPDYMADMRKILFTDATLRQSGRFAGGDGVEFSGVVVYNLIYLDSEGELSSVEFTSDYDYLVKCSGEDYDDSLASTRVSNYAIRLIGPRKISARASLVSSVSLFEEKSLAVSGNSFATEKPEVNRASIKVKNCRASSVVEREYAEMVCRLDGAIADELSVLYPTVEVMPDEVKAEGDGVDIKGKIKMSALIKNGEEDIYSVEKLLPFEESVELDAAEGFDHLVPQLSVCSVKASVNPDENGCEVVISCIIELCAVGEGNRQIDPILDAYLKQAPTENGYEDFRYTTYIDSVVTRGSHNAEFSRSDTDSENMSSVIFLTATPKVERVERDGGSVTVFGEVRYSGVATENQEDKHSYVGVKFSSPFEVNVNINCQNTDNLQVETDVQAYNCTAYLDQDKLHATCMLESTVTVSEEKSCRILASMSHKEGEKYESDASLITVYYPTDGDTLFSVAKRFHTSGLKLAKDNDISELVFASDNPSGALGGVKKLIIY